MSSSETPGQSGRAKLVELQALRGIAALLVVLYHIDGHTGQFYEQDWLGGVFRNGNLGVHVFFVISGFIIYRTNQHAFGRRDRVWPYLYRRFVRIYPIYWIVLALTLFALAVTSSLPSDPSFAAHFLPSLVLFQGAQPMIVGVAWTLCYEVMFYLVFAAMLFLPRHWAHAGLIGWAVLCIVNYFAPLGLGGMPFSLYVLEFLIGCLAAYLAARLRFRVGASVFWIVTACLLVGSMVSRSETQQMSAPMAVLLIALAFAAVLASGLMRRSDRVGWVDGFASRLGDASYSIYLIHYLVIQTAYSLAFNSGVLPVIDPMVFNAIVLVLAVGAGFALYAWLERPVLEALRRRAPAGARIPAERTAG